MNTTLKQRGLSLVELMIGLALGLIVLVAMIVIYSNTSRSRAEMEKSNRQTENGRYASQLLYNDLRMAGHYAEFDPTPLTSPAALPDACQTDVAALIDALSLHVQGGDNVGGANPAPSCVSDLKAGTDVIAIRRTSACAAGSANCAAFENGAPHFQAALCAPSSGSPLAGTELSYPVVSNADYAAQYYSLGTAMTDFLKHKSNCVDLADTFRFQVHVYFIANNNEPGDGIPTLKRAELGSGGFTIVPLVDGIEDMQINYGIDTTGDGIPDEYKADPADVAGWRNVMAARINLLVRNNDITQGYEDKKTYNLGLDAKGDEIKVAPGGKYKRHVYATTARFANPSWRRQ